MEDTSIASGTEKSRGAIEDNTKSAHVNEQNIKIGKGKGPIKQLVMTMKEMKENKQKLAMFFGVHISRYLRPTRSNKVNKNATFHTKHLEKVGKINWCQVVSKDLWVSITNWKQVKEQKYKLSKLARERC